ncbi:unnamed protein product, partial [marine sediment metagenome]
MIIGLDPHMLVVVSNSHISLICNNPAKATCTPVFAVSRQNFSPGQFSGYCSHAELFVDEQIKYQP